jgi:hypothetical protein
MANSHFRPSAVVGPRGLRDGSRLEAVIGSERQPHMNVYLRDNQPSHSIELEAVVRSIGVKGQVMDQRSRMRFPQVVTHHHVQPIAILE